MSAPTLAVWLETHPFANPETTTPPDVAAAYALNQGENVLVDITVTDYSEDPVPAADIKTVLLSIRRNEATALEWSWISEGVQSPQIDVQDGHVYLEISKENTVLLAGLYDFEVQIGVANNDFFYSNAETTVYEAVATLFVRAVPVNAVPPV